MKYGILLIVAVVGLLALLGSNEDKAMSDCQVNSAYDECFYAINH